MAGLNLSVSWLAEGHCSSFYCLLGSEGGQSGTGIPVTPAPQCHASPPLSSGVFFLFQFFACLVMIAYGVSAFFSFQAWRGVGSNAATSQMAGGYA